MSEDLRNSIYLWVGGIAFVGLFWACLRFDVFVGVPVAWVQGAFIVMLVLNGLKSISMLLKRRAKKRVGTHA